jgi:hypothetical protein
MRLAGLWRCAIGLALASLGGCGGGKETVGDVSSYLSSVESWDRFSPPQESRREEGDIPNAECPSGNISSSGKCEQTMTEANLPLYDDDGTLLGYGDQQYTCTTTRYTLWGTPDRLVMLSPDVELLWPGALLQGKSVRDGIGSLLPLPIRERTPIKVSIPALATDSNFRLVENPDLAAVNQAVAEMIGSASENNVSTPSTISFTMRTFDSEQEFALAVGMSAKYLGFKGSASSSVNRSSAERTVAVVLEQKMFEVVIEPPESPEAFFSADLTPEVLQRQVDLGRISRDNPPVYVSNIVYGKIMMFTLTSSASETDIKAALNASYRGLVFSGNVTVDSHYKKVLSEGRISITSLGGGEAATEAMISSGDWRSYFVNGTCTDPKDPSTCTHTPTPLAMAAPLSYTFRALADGRVAKVSESATYDARDCVPGGRTTGFVLTDFDLNPSHPWTEPLEGWQRVGGAFADATVTQSRFCRFFGCLAQAEPAANASPWYFSAPEAFLGNKRDWYGGELSYWITYDSPAVTPVSVVPNYDVVLKAGPENGQLTLTWIAAQPPQRQSATKYVVPLSNDSCTGVSSTENGHVYYRGCWMVSGETLASPADLLYALENLTALMVRGKYVNLAAGQVSATFLDEVKLSGPSRP